MKTLLLLLISAVLAMVIAFRIEQALVAVAGMMK